MSGGPFKAAVALLGHWITRGPSVHQQGLKANVCQIFALFFFQELIQ